MGILYSKVCSERAVGFQNSYSIVVIIVIKVSGFRV